MNSGSRSRIGKLSNLGSFQFSRILAFDPLDSPLPYDFFSSCVVFRGHGHRLRGRPRSFRRRGRRLRGRPRSLREHAAGLRGQPVSRTQVYDTGLVFIAARSAFSDARPVFNGCCRDTTAMTVLTATSCPRTSARAVSARILRVPERLSALRCDAGPPSRRAEDGPQRGPGRSPADRSGDHGERTGDVDPGRTGDGPGTDRAGDRGRRTEMIPDGPGRTGVGKPGWGTGDCRRSVAQFLSAFTLGERERREPMSGNG